MPAAITSNPQIELKSYTVPMDVLKQAVESHATPLAPSTTDMSTAPTSSKQPDSRLHANDFAHDDLNMFFTPLPIEQKDRKRRVSAQKYQTLHARTGRKTNGNELRASSLEAHLFSPHF